MHAPPDDLSDVVEAFWSGLWDLRAGEPYLAEAFAEPAVHVVFERGASRVVGPCAGPVRRRLDGRGAVRAVKLRAGAARVLVAIPAARLANRAVPLASAFRIDARSAARIEREVLGTIDDRAAFELVSAWLRERRDPEQLEAARAAMELLEQIAIDTQIVSVTRLCRLTELKARALEALFREHVGLAPKWLIRRARLLEAAESAQDPTERLKTLRRELGYTNLTQLWRDLTRVSGAKKKRAVKKRPKAKAKVKAKTKAKKRVAVSAKRKAKPKRKPAVSKRRRA